MPSPNVRYERPTKDEFDRIRRWAVHVLNVGDRAVTVDMLAAALQTVGWAHQGELLDALRAERERRAK